MSPIVLHRNRLNIHAFELRFYIAWETIIGNDGVQFCELADMGEASLIAFGSIKNGNHLLGILNHLLIEQSFFHIRRGDTVFKGERVYAKEEFVVREIS